jgi:uncharacterized membrane protein
VHNTYFTLPVLFAMLSNHYSMTYSAEHNWLVLLLIMTSGVLIRQFFVLRHKGVSNWWYPGVAVVLLGLTAFLARPASLRPVVPKPAAVASAASSDRPAAAGAAPAAAAPASGVSFAQVQEVVQARCIQCHAAAPTLMPTPGKGILLDSKEAILQHAQQIYQQASVQKAMPLGNMTKITDEERELIGKWFEAGATGN